MADIEQTPGELNIPRIIKGDDFAWTAVFDGDATADTWTAKVRNGSLADITLSVVATYSGVTLKTTLTFTITAAQSAILVEAMHPWYCLKVSGGATRTFLQGTIGAYPRW